MQKLESNLTLLHYSLVDSNLNITLECSSKESQAILEQEKQSQERQKQAHIESNTTNPNAFSTALLHPILEDNTLTCAHGGKVTLESKIGKPFRSKGVPMILESDLLYSKILGCNNPMPSGGPCTQIAVILPSARGLKNMQDRIDKMHRYVSH